MHELQTGDFQKAVPVFQGLKHCTPAQAVVEGNNPGRIFIDNIHDPGTAFIWTKWGYFYLAGEINNAKFNEELHELLVDELLPASRQLGESAPILYPYPENWEGKLAVILKGRTPKKIYRRTFTFSSLDFTGLNWRDQITEGYRIERVDEKLIASLKAGGDIAREITCSWNSLDEYFAEAPGVCLLYGDEIISLCIAHSIGAGRAEVSIFTPEQYRGRNFATITASAFIEQSLARNLLPNWECFWDHTISCALAEKLGYRKQFDYPVYFWEER